tara:strand:- start:1111 stop:1308 length:198 start_codon:yes stop_codon:yes gene_type:complete
MKVKLIDCMLEIAKNKNADFIDKKLLCELTQKRDSNLLVQNRNLLELEKINFLKNACKVSFVWCY